MCVSIEMRLWPGSSISTRTAVPSGRSAPIVAASIRPSTMWRSLAHHARTQPHQSPTGADACAAAAVAAAVTLPAAAAAAAASACPSARCAAAAAAAAPSRRSHSCASVIAANAAPWRHTHSSGGARRHLSRAARPPAAASESAPAGDAASASAGAADGDALDGWHSGAWAAGLQPWQHQQHAGVGAPASASASAPSPSPSAGTSALSGEAWLHELERGEHARQALAVSALAEEAAALATQLNNMQQQTANTQIDTLHRGDQVRENAAALTARALQCCHRSVMGIAPHSTAHVRLYVATCACARCCWACTRSWRPTPPTPLTV